MIVVYNVQFEYMHMDVGGYMATICLKAHAKINLTLDVLGKRDDGYHEVEMIMQQISLYDDVTLRTLSKGISVFTGHHYVPDDDSNIAVKAAKLFFLKTGIEGGVEITIKKRIPVAAGLAGGSADAAAVLIGLNHLYDGGLTLKALMDFGKVLGADVPFCIHGGTCLSQGIGEQLTALDMHAQYWIILVKPPVGVSTKEVYESLSVSALKAHPKTKQVVDALQCGNVYHMMEGMYNVLEEVTAQKLKVIGEIEARLMGYGAKKAMMSGSGPTVFGVFTRQDWATKALKNLKKHYQEVFLVRPISGGEQSCRSTI